MTTPQEARALAEWIGQIDIGNAATEAAAMLTEYADLLERQGPVAWRWPIKLLSGRIEWRYTQSKTREDAEPIYAAPQPATWTDADADAARLALELECLLTDKDVPMPALSRWWNSAHDALELHRKRMAEPSNVGIEPPYSVGSNDGLGAYPRSAPNKGLMMDNQITVLPDGSAFATASWPLPKTHWLYAEGHNVPPMPLRMGTDNPERQAMNEKVWAAAKYAVRSATMNGKEPDFDPDALCQNMVVGLLGYHTADGLSSDSWANPPKTAPGA